MSDKAIEARIGEPFAGIMLLLSKYGFRMKSLSTVNSCVDMRFDHADGTVVTLAVVRPARR